MLTRVERNRMHRKSKRRFRLFIIVVVLLLLVSIYQVNRSYEDLVGSSRTTDIFAVERSEGAVSIILLGKRLEFPKSTLEKAFIALQKTSNKIFEAMQIFIQQVSN